VRTSILVKIERHSMHTSEDRCMPSIHILWSRPLLISYTSHVSALCIVHIPSNSSSHLFHHCKSSRFHLLGEGREQPVQNVSILSVGVHSFFSRSLPDEAGPGVTAGVAKVDDQGKVAVVDGDLGETNDAGDALLL
jgi:hypothetical protein